MGQALASNQTVADEVLGRILGQFAVMAEEFRKELPEGWAIEVAVEGDSFSLELLDPSGVVCRGKTGQLCWFAHRMREAVDWAKGLVGNPTEKKLRLFYKSTGTDDVRCICGESAKRDSMIQGAINMFTCDVEALLDGPEYQQNGIECELTVSEMSDEEVAAIPEM